MDEQTLRRLMGGEREDKLAMLGQGLQDPNVDVVAMQNAYDQIKDLRTEDSDYQDHMRKKLMEMFAKKGMR